jgi:hypothetical protein
VYARRSLARRLPEATITGLGESLVGLAAVQLLGGDWALGVVTYQASHPRHLTELGVREARALALAVLEWAQVIEDRNAPPSLVGDLAAAVTAASDRARAEGT